MRIGQVVCLSACLFLMVFRVSDPVRADGFINPFAGYHFGGDSACPTVFHCESTKLGLGVSIGVLGSVVGFEEDFGYAKNFFGTEPLLNSSVVTLMSNLMIAPKLGPVRPYVVGGFGLMRVTAATGLINVVVSDTNNLGYDLGGGLMIFFGSHVGLRGDVRGYRSLQDLKVFGIAVPGTRLRFGRAAGGLILAF